METSNPVKPILTVILPGMLGAETVMAALDTWEAQTRRGQIEILLLCPDADTSRPNSTPGLNYVATGSLRLHEARALGVQRARADYVCLAEDHCVPEPDFAEWIIARIEEGWDGVGPALRPGGNPHTGLSHAEFLLGYGQWMEPVAGGPVGVLPGHNIVLRRDTLMALGDRLKDELLMAGFLVQRLHREGQRFVLDPRARMRHFDPPALRSAILIYAIVGLGWGSVRTSRWPWLARLVYPLACPAIVARHWGRGVVHYFRAGSQAKLRASSVLWGIPLALVSAGGEVVGALAGTDRAAIHVWRCEIKPVTRDRIASNRQGVW